MSSEPVFDANGWATIDSAPDDHEIVWVWHSEFQKAVEREADGDWWRYWPHNRFTHWQPRIVPKPPVGT
jgi:hypothetical protein